METPIYVFTGLLESGKTTLLKEVAGEDDFLEPGTTLLIQCEEGEESFDKSFLDQYDMVKIDVVDLSELNASFWTRCEQTFAPTQIMIEYNGMWEMDALFSSGFPEDWFLGGVYSTVDTSTAELYLTNMRKNFMEPLKDSNLIIFNRCTDKTDRMKFRRNLKALNPRVEVAFERTDGTMFGNESEQMPFDYSGQTVEIEDMDYGLWYLDAMEHPDRYLDKRIKFNARFCASAKPSENYFIPGRHVMTCCEDDIQFLGFVCYFDGNRPYEHGDWVGVTVSFDYRFCEIYGEEGPVLKLTNIDATQQPEPELVTFS